MSDRCNHGSKLSARRCRRCLRAQLEAATRSERRALDERDEAVERAEQLESSTVGGAVASEEAAWRAASEAHALLDRARKWVAFSLRHPGAEGLEALEAVHRDLEAYRPKARP